MNRQTPYPEPPIRGWRLATSLAYVLLLGAGVWVLSEPPVSYAVDVWIRVLWGAALLIGGCAMTIGAGLAAYRWEWLGAWVVAFGLANYSVLSWTSVLTESAGHGPRALVISAFALLIYARDIYLGRVDRDAQERKRRDTERAPDE